MHTQRNGRYRLPYGEIRVGDSCKILASVGKEKAAVVFADPPYNLQLGGELKRPAKPLQTARTVAAVDDPWDQIGDFRAYDDFTRSWLSAARDVLAPDGTIWITGTYHNIFRVGAILQDLGFWLLNDVIWRKSNPMPNFRGRRFTNAHETILWAAKSRKSRYRFNYQALKSLNEGKQMRSDWTMPICSGSERLRDEAGVKIHPTQKPEALIYRALVASSLDGDLVVDPFFGSGTTGAVATRLKRRFVGIEASPAYARVAATRIADCRPDDTFSAKLVPGKSRKPDPEVARSGERMPFGQLIEQGVLRAGSVLTDATGRHAARVRADGRLVSSSLDPEPVAIDGSIHLLAGYFSGRAGCDGWDFWYVDQGGSKTPLRRLRTKLDLRGSIDDAAA